MAHLLCSVSQKSFKELDSLRSLKNVRNIVLAGNPVVMKVLSREEYERYVNSMVLEALSVRLMFKVAPRPVLFVACLFRRLLPLCLLFLFAFMYSLPCLAFPFRTLSCALYPAGYLLISFFSVSLHQGVLLLGRSPFVVFPLECFSGFASVSL